MLDMKQNMNPYIDRYIDQKPKRKQMIFIMCFVALNMLNGFLQTTTIFNKNLSPYDRSFFMVMNYIIGDFGVMLLFLALGVLIIKSDYKRARYLTIVTVVLSVLSVLMSIYFYNYNMMFSFSNLDSFTNPGGGGMIIDFVLGALSVLIANAQFLALFPALIMVILFLKYYHKRRNDKEFRKVSFDVPKNRVYLGISLTIISALLMINVLSIHSYQMEDTWYEDNDYPLYGIQTVGIYNYYFYDAFKAVFPGEVRNLQAKKDAVLERLDSYSAAEVNSAAYAGKNLLLIQAESLNNYTIGLKIAVEKDGEITYYPVTPRINKLLGLDGEKEGTTHYANNFYTSVGIGNTSDAEFSAMTGLYSTGDRITVFNYIDQPYDSMANHFKEKDYYTVSVHGNTKSFYNRGKIHEDVYGFDDHIGLEDFNTDDYALIHSWINDEDLLKYTIDIMKEKADQGIKTFAFPITVSCHTPFSNDVNMPSLEELLGFEGDVLMQGLLIKYLRHIAYMDYCIGEAIDYLEEVGLADSTVVMFYGDHGASMSYDDFFNNKDTFINELNPIKFLQPGLEDFEKKLLYRLTNQQIPFIIYDKGGADETNFISTVRSEVDICKTVHDLFDLDKKYNFGKHILSSEAGFCYNPRNGDIFTDDFVISAVSREVYAFNEEASLKSQKEAVDYYFDYKDFNDKLLKYKIFAEVLNETTD